jgi:hypothetical protein
VIGPFVGMAIRPRGTEQHERALGHFPQRAEPADRDPEAGMP